MNWLLSKVIGNPVVLFWLVLGAFTAGATSGGLGAWKVQGWRLDALQARFDGFVTEVRIKGEQAEADRDKTIKADKAKKEKADAEHETTLAALRADVKRLRNARASSSFVPAAAPSSPSPDRACFKRSELERALREFDTETQGIVEEGDAARVGLDTGKLWAMP